MILFAGMLPFALLIAFMAFLVGTEILWILVDIPSLVVILLPLVYYLIVSKGHKVLGSYIKNSFKKDYIYNAYELKAISNVAKGSTKVIMTMSYLNIVFALIIVLTNVDDPSFIGVALAVMLISLFYALGISYLMFFPLQSWAENKLDME